MSRHLRRLLLRDLLSVKLAWSRKAARTVQPAENESPSSTAQLFARRSTTLVSGARSMARTIRSTLEERARKERSELGDLSETDLQTQRAERSICQTP